MWKPIILDVECIVCNKSLQKINHHDPREVTRKMGKIANGRRSRTPNWSADEKQYLLELIRERKEVVVSKTSTGPIHYEEKDVAWNEILRELAARFGNKFDGSNVKKVKTQWQNMKRIAREEISINGPEVEKYTRQSRDVCGILDLVKDGVLVQDAEASPNSSSATIETNIEVKTERIDDEINPPECELSIDIANAILRCDPSEADMETDPPPVAEDPPQAIITPEAVQLLESSGSGSSVSEHASEYEPEERPLEIVDTAARSVSVNTDSSFFEDSLNGNLNNMINPFQRELQEFLRYSSTEKQLKVESLKEEHEVLRAMRETAELNKIIAEQRLKHVLWAKKQDMAMYSGEPGSGAGKGGGGGGAIREAGGAFGKMEAAREDEYFYKKQKEQLQNIKSHLDKEIAFHQEQIKRHEDAIRRHKSQMTEMEPKN